MIIEVYEALKAAGAPEDKAQAAASVLADSIPSHIDFSTLATKADLAAEIASVRAELKSEIATVKADLKVEIATVTPELKSEIRSVKDDMHKWVVGAFGFQTIVILGALISLVKVLAW